MLRLQFTCCRTVEKRLAVMAVGLVRLVVIVPLKVVRSNRHPVSVIIRTSNEKLRELGKLISVLCPPGMQDLQQVRNMVQTLQGRVQLIE